jgi:hypothetical protein
MLLAVRLAEPISERARISESICVTRRAQVTEAAILHDATTLSKLQSLGADASWG